MTKYFASFYPLDVLLSLKEILKNVHFHSKSSATYDFISLVTIVTDHH